MCEGVCRSDVDIYILKMAAYIKLSPLPQTDLHMVFLMSSTKKCVCVCVCVYTHIHTPCSAFLEVIRVFFKKNWFDAIDKEQV